MQHIKERDWDVMFKRTITIAGALAVLLCACTADTEVDDNKELYMEELQKASEITSDSQNGSVKVFVIYEGEDTGIQDTYYMSVNYDSGKIESVVVNSENKLMNAEVFEGKATSSKTKHHRECVIMSD